MWTLSAPRLTRRAIIAGEAGIVTAIAAQEHEPDSRKRLAHGNRRIAAGPVAKVEVHHDDIGIQLARQGGGLTHGAGLPDHDHVLLPVEQQAEAFRDELMVLDDDDPDRPRAAVGPRDGPP